ncbi:zinc ribbon domain-containing protein [Lactiplantibacillus garii]|uniref:Zinc ribbon domain-containing protein n=1 Tax=Lactiplantibacillus garii TaxID=2306423 RepID=A0A3R8KJM2_9LACO|nr:zinc ribbon domain-containing protein [Lactiplantibacillus garii]RRK09390.1 zinc ribbon domain-containing protein [Lactiplantibacillus garii]
MEHGKTYRTTCGAGKGAGHKFCGNCGAAVTAEQEFCTTCGQKLGATSTSAKGTDAVHKVTDTVVQKTTNLADLASQKIKPFWLAAGLKYTKVGN